MVRNIHSRVRQLQYQWHLTLAKLMDFWIVLIKAKKMRSKNRHERNTEKKIKIRQEERSKWKPVMKTYNLKENCDFYLK